MRSLTARALPGALALASFFFAGPACNDSSEYHPAGPRPVITNAALTGNITSVNCDPALTGGACPFSIDLYFELPVEQFVRGAVVRFQRDGSDYGTDRYFPLKDLKYGAGTNKEASVSIETSVPPNLVGTGTLFTFSVRLLTGLGEESDESTLTITVTSIPVTKTGTSKDVDAGN